MNDFELLGRLNVLESSGLIRMIQARPELEYLFRHALVQDAAYASLVKQDRRQLHRTVGEALERTYADRLHDGELAPLLARHFNEAGDESRALKYFTLAGDAAARVYANAEAVMHYTSAIDIARRTAHLADAPEVLTHLYTSLGQALELRARHAEALAKYVELESLARQRGDRSMELTALMARAKIYATLNSKQNPAQARTVLEQCLSLARELDDRAAECKVLWNLMLLLLWGAGDQHQAVAYGEASLAIARELDLREQLAFDLNDLAYGYMSTEQWQRVRAALDESRALWRELGNLPMLVDNLSNSVLLELRDGHFESAITLSEQALHIARSIDNTWGRAGSQTYIGLVYVERGEPDRAIATMEEAVRLGEQVGHPAPIIATRADLAWTYGTLGAFERAFELARLAQARTGDIYFLHALPIVVLARLHLLTGDLETAATTLQAAHRELRPEGLQWFAPILVPLADAELALARRDYAHALDVMDSLLADLREGQSRYLLADALYLKGKALAAIGLTRVEEARVTLREARAEAEAIGSRRILWPILIALAEIEDRCDRQAEARALRLPAREIIEYIADHCPPDLRESFLGLPQVQAVTREV